MKLFVGVDLGSTTTKAVVMDEAGKVVGKGITNSRSNYDTACAIAESEAFIDTRFTLLGNALTEQGTDKTQTALLLGELERYFRLQQFLNQLASLRDATLEEAGAKRYQAVGGELKDRLMALFAKLTTEMVESFQSGAPQRSEFFRDLAGAGYMRLADEFSQPDGVTYDLLVNVFDKCIIRVENMVLDLSFESNIGHALDATLRAIENQPQLALTQRDQVEKATAAAMETALDVLATVGTGYGRARLPFPKEQIRSEILCHGLGAHQMYPETATVLDIGGQDTKAIQVDGDGIVTSFQMNDRCAAGCGRYLGYIADELNLGVQELGPLAMQGSKAARINSTCTVFAGAELRERLNNGEAREDILLGLHRAIILRAMALLARSGGVDNQFTFTGGVANNPAAVQALQGLIEENYGERIINISPNSIYTGALGAAMFAQRSI